MNRQVIAPQRGVAFTLERGDSLVVVDPLGGQVADLFCFAADDLHDALSSGRSIDYNETIALGAGHTLYAQSGKAMLRLVEDTCRAHDFLITPCSLQMFQMISRTKSYHPSCLENLITALAPHGITPHQIGTTFNIFMNVPVANDGRIRVLPPRSTAGAYVRFEAEMNLLVGLTACSDEGSNGGECKPIEYEVVTSRPSPT